MEKMKKSEKKIAVDVVAAGLTGPARYVLEASDKELKTLAERFQVEKIHSLTANLTIYPGEIIRISGHLQAVTRRECVISLDKFDEKMSEDFEVLYADNPPAESDEIIDPIINGRIHLGEVVAEQYGLALNPFPKKPGVKNPYQEVDEERQTPFSDLKKILKKRS